MGEVDVYFHQWYGFLLLKAELKSVFNDEKIRNDSAGHRRNDDFNK